MSSAVVCFALLFLVLSGIEGLPKCGLNEILQEEGYDCQTCINQYVKCALVREQKCYCQEGYTRTDDNGFCIRLEDCPSESLCGLNEVLKDEGLTCQTCANYQFVKCAPAQQRQCYCNDGYVRNDIGICTAIEDCPTVQAK